MALNIGCRTRLPSVTNGKSLREQVTRLIRNKIEPLSFKQYVLKSGRYQIKPEGKNMSLNLKAENQQIEGGKKVRQNRKTEHKQNQNRSPIKVSKRRKALVQVQVSCFDKKYFVELQSKVEKHIMLKKMDLMENEYTYAEQCSKKEKEQRCHRLAQSPLQKYLQIFQQSQKPSQKIRRVEQHSCEQMLKQIKSAKSIKHIECIEQNMRNMVNNDKKSMSHKDKKDEIHSNNQKRMKKENKKLRDEIMSDIKKEYENQGSSKIRISINHKKMIQIM